MAKTLYQVLGIARDASLVEIEAAFRERAAEFKDKTYAGTDTLDDVREAYRVLSNLRSREDYDATLPVAPGARRAAQDSETESGWPGWVKWALPFLIVVVIGVWMKSRSKPEPQMVVKSVTRIDSRTVTVKESAIPVPLPAAATQAVPLPKAGGNAEEVFSLASASIARVRAVDNGGRGVSQGSGVVVGPGAVITNCHVTGESSDVSVKVGGEEYSASVQVADEELDLCRLSVPGLSAPAVATSSVGQVRTGQRVYAIGAPHGLELTISEGIVSSLREFPNGTVIQTTAAISPGSSGGGLFDASGRLIGIVTFQHRFGQNLNFAVPSDWIGEMQARTR